MAEAFCLLLRFILALLLRIVYMFDQNFYASFPPAAIYCHQPETSRFITGDREPMAIVWQSNKISQYSSVRKRSIKHSQGIGIKVSYLLLHQLDLVLTVFATSVGLTELNPIMRSLLASPFQLVAIKLIIPLFIVWLVPGKFLIPAVGLLTLVIIWNIKELLFILL